MSISDVLSNAKMPSIHNLSSVVGPAIVQAAVDNKVAAITIVSSLILIPVGGPTGLLLKGFGMGAGGVGAGTFAAGIQSGIGDVVAGSAFAALQSAGMTIGSVAGAGQALAVTTSAVLGSWWKSDGKGGS